MTVLDLDQGELTACTIGYEYAAQGRVRLLLDGDRNMGVHNLFAISLMAIMVSGIAAAQDIDSGKTAYKLCAGCHGFEGQGNQLVGAPALAGQDSWYLKRQIENYRDGIRGTHKDDSDGRKMATMATALTDHQLSNLVAYIGKLQAANPEPAVKGDIASGKAAYSACAACHGPSAEGNQLLNAPALTHIDDWYQLRQLKNFKQGIRGRNPEDTYGQQMAPMAGILADEQAMQDVVAYIASLR
ncbi:MAG: c-type cytochrome [Gammaproteobacteria bacterium]|nr:c-type cytochrome [Gammaproteobacteria bacterium]